MGALKKVAISILLVATSVECRDFYYPPYQRVVHHPLPPFFPGSHPRSPPSYDYYLPPPPPPPSTWTECAQIRNQFHGTIHFGLNQETGPLHGYNFIPVSVDMRERCVLVLVDTVGKVNVYHDSKQLRGEDCWIYPIAYAHCESCLGKVPQLSSDPSSTCAILYEAPFCSTALGFATEVSDGEEEDRLDHELYRKVSSLVVRNGCGMEIYDAENFQGRAAFVNGTVDVLPYEWDNQIASFKCTCDTGNATTTPSTTTPETMTTSDPPISSSTTETPSSPTTETPTTTMSTPPPSTTFPSTTTSEPSSTSTTTTPVSSTTTEIVTSPTPSTSTTTNATSPNPTVSTSSTTQRDDYIYR